MSISKNRKNRLLLYLITILFAALVAACGGDGGDPETGGTPTPPPPVTVTRTLTGTAATGAAVEGTVTIIDADGNTLITQTDTTGAYSINLGGNSGPYLIRIVPNNNTLPVLYSYATNSGVANITQFTSLALVLAFQNLSDAFANWTTVRPNWSRAELDQALATINANFSPALQIAGVEPTRYDLFTASFDANQTGIDAFLDNYTVTLDYATNGYTITNNGTGEDFILNTEIDRNGYYIGMNATFNPVGTSVWQLTTTETDNGVQMPPEIHTIEYTIDTIPWSKERFEELFWGTVPPPTTQTVNCSDIANVTCDMTISVTQLDTNYNITGTGEINTIIESSAAFSWSLSGTIQGFVNGIPFSQDINETNSWSYIWTWKRIS